MLFTFGNAEMSLTDKRSFICPFYQMPSFQMAEHILDTSSVNNDLPAPDMSVCRCQLWLGVWDKDVFRGCSVLHNTTKTVYQHIQTWTEKNGGHFAQDIFEHIFVWIFVFCGFKLQFILEGYICIQPALFEIMAFLSCIYGFVYL